MEYGLNGIDLQLGAECPDVRSGGWSFELVQEEGSNEAELVFTARIDEGWHLYSQFLGDDGPIPTQFYFKDSANYERTGPTEEITPPVLEYDPNFEMELLYFSEEAVFSQKGQDPEARGGGDQGGAGVHGL